MGWTGLHPIVGGGRLPRCSGAPPLIRPRVWIELSAPSSRPASPPPKTPPADADLGRIGAFPDPVLAVYRRCGLACPRRLTPPPPPPATLDMACGATPARRLKPRRRRRPRRARHGSGAGVTRQTVPVSSFYRCARARSPANRGATASAAWARGREGDRRRVHHPAAVAVAAAPAASAAPLPGACPRGAPPRTFGRATAHHRHPQRFVSVARGGTERGGLAS